MTFTQLEVLLAVVDAGSFSKAADALAMSQPGISHAIASLEAEFGVTLINRSRTGITLTGIGEKIVARIREMLHQRELIAQEIALETGLHTGALFIGSFPSILARWLPRLLRSFQSAYPGIDLKVKEGSYEEIESWLAAGTVHLGFITLPARQLESVALVQDEMVALLAPGTISPSDVRHGITLGELARLPFIMPIAGCQTLIGDLFDCAKCHPHVQFEIRESATIVNMVREGIGASILPRMALPQHMDGVQVASLAPSPVFREIGLAVRSLSLASPAARAFLQFAKRWVQENDFAAPEPTA